MFFVPLQKSTQSITTMNKIYKILISAVAATTIVGCTTDTTNDLGIENTGKTKLTLSLGELRTQLDTKEGDSYPLTWSEGDQISVNGIASDALIAEYGAGTENASFTFANRLQTPYFIAYPAAEAGQVKFAATQHYTSNTSFDNGVATMYAYSDNDSGIVLKHLTGVLKIGVKGEATLLSARISTAGREPIAGTFNASYNTENDELALTPVEGTTSEFITYNFDKQGKGLNLSTCEETTYIHIAVPAIPNVVYDELYVILQDSNGGIMYETIKAGNSKPLKAGTVRNFGEITYKATDAAEAFVISDYASLLAFKTAVEAGSMLDAIVTADIDITKEAGNNAWTPINAPDYTCQFNGNGFVISGLTAPLFDTVSATTIKGVHLTKVSISADYISANTGALVNTFKGRNISHCSAKGNINLARENHVANKVGGLVGSMANFAQGWTVSDCVSNCTITLTISETTATDAEGNALSQQTTAVGGVVADSYNAAPTGVVVNLTNNTNNGAIKVTGNTKATLLAGGVISRYYNYISNVTNCHNTADIAVELGASAVVDVAGILSRCVMGTSACIGYHLTATDCSNSGNVSVKLTGNSEGTSYSSAGGCFGDLQHTHAANITLANCNNSGDVSVVSTGTITGQYHLGGLAGCLYGRISASNCNNTGKSIKFEGKTVKHRACVGGLVGRGAVRAADDTYEEQVAENTFTLSKCKNYADIAFDITETNDSQSFIGGAVGISYSYSTGLATISIDEVENYGGITVSSKNWTTETSALDSNGEKNIEFAAVGGVVGSNWIDNSSPSDPYKCPFSITNCKNGTEDSSKKILITGEKNHSVAVGGIIGVNTYCNIDLFKIDNCTNNMTLEHNSATASTSKLSFGGIVGRIAHQDTNQESTISNSTNNGAIIVKAKSAADVSVGGIFAAQNTHRTGDSKKIMRMKLTTVTNNAAISVSDIATCTNLWVGGIMGRTERIDAKSTNENFTLSKVVNKGDVSVLNVAPTKSCHIGGAVGNITRSLSNIECKCTVTVSEKLSAGMLVGDDVAATSYALSNCTVGGTFVEGTTSTELTWSNYAKYIFTNRSSSSYSGVTLWE